MWPQPRRATTNWIGQGSISPRLSGAVFLLLAMLVSIGTTSACETPVYRYAMYRWQPTPYEVYAFHDASNAEAHTGVEKAIADVSEGTDNRANIVFIPVNLTTDPELNGVTPDIKEAWTSQQSQTLPSYLISTPYGVQIYSGKLDAEAIKSIVESPARKQMAQQLEAGKIGVLLFLSGKDKQENEKTKQILEGLVKEVAEGKISLYTAPSAAPSAAPAADEKPAVPNPGLELGMIEVNRSDEQEAWLVRSLLAMESDLPDESRPMVFLAYGRGRALLPYIGAGITRENLIREVEFISGACSCTVKEQNPGVDLLVRYDWEAASAALADRFGTEEGNESQFGPSDFLPQLIIPSSEDPPVAGAGETPAAGTKIDEPGTEPGQDPDAIAVATTGDISIDDGGPAPQTGTDDVGTDDVEPAENAVTTDDSAAVQDEPVESSVSKDGDHGDLASVTPAEAFSESIPAFKERRTYVSMLVVGGGLALGLVILFGLTFFVMRPH